MVFTVCEQMTVHRVPETCRLVLIEMFCRISLVSSQIWFHHLRLKVHCTHAVDSQYQHVVPKYQTFPVFIDASVPVQRPAPARPAPLPSSPPAVSRSSVTPKVWNILPCHCFSVVYFGYALYTTLELKPETISLLFWSLIFPWGQCTVALDIAHTCHFPMQFILWTLP